MHERNDIKHEIIVHIIPVNIPALLNKIGSTNTAPPIIELAKAMIVWDWVLFFFVDINKVWFFMINMYYLINYR